jgi:hypothetical protein
MTPGELIARFTEWEDERQRLSEMESEGDFPRASEWEWSDDEAVLLLDIAMGFIIQRSIDEGGADAR